jgi:energy-coupling factor transporter ATP-binding protein EcfA2
MLQNIKIARFKSIKLFEQPLENLTVLVGANNSGKSSVLQAIHFAVAIAQSRRRLVDQQDVQTEASFTIAPQQVIYSPLNDVIALGHGGRLTQTGGKQIQVDFEFTNGHRGDVRIYKGKNRNLSVVVSGAHVIGRIEDLRQPFSVYVPGLAGIAKAESFIARGQLLRAVARGDANLVLRNVLYALQRETEKWNSFTASLRDVFPDNQLHIAFAPESDEFIEVSIWRNEAWLPLDAAGTGFLQTVQILSYIYLFEPVLTLLDEPDSHLHPNNQRALAGLLDRFAEEGRTQIIIATHSRHVLDQLRGRGKRVWMKQGQAQNNTEHLDLLVDLGALDSAEGLLAKGIKYVFLTEDEKKYYLKAVILAYGLPEAQFQIWSYKGSSKLDAAEALGGFIREVSNTTKVIVHRDSDYLLEDDLTRLRAQYKRVNLTLFVTPGVDIEGLFCRKDHLKAMNPGDDLLVDAAYVAAIANCSSDMKAKAKEGAKQVELYRFRNGLATRGEEECVNWLNALDVTTERWMHGKTFLSAIRYAFQQQNARNLKTTMPSSYLKFPELTAILQPAPVAAATGAPVNPQTPAPVAQAVANPAIGTTS